MKTHFICLSRFLFSLDVAVSTLCMLGNFSCFSCRLLTFQILTFQKILSGTVSECQIVWIHIRTDILLVLIWVQTDCKGYQQTTKIAASKERVNLFSVSVGTQWFLVAFTNLIFQFCNRCKNKSIKALEKVIVLHVPNCKV